MSLSPASARRRLLGRTLVGVTSCATLTGGLLAALAAGGCDSTSGLTPSLTVPPADSSGDAQRPVETTPIKFRDVAAEIGLDYVWPEQARPMKSPDSFGSGCAFFDYDQDGWQDVLTVGDPHPSLYHNVGGKFVDVTADSGLTVANGNWNGCAVGDYDDDGALDVLVTGLHCLILFRNVGGGHFEDVTASAGLDPANREHWGASAGFMDLDRDGDLDLVILNYCIWNDQVKQHCELAPGVFSGCPPSEYEAEYGEIWRNLGEGRFEFVLEGTDMDSTGGKALVIAFSDIDDDGFVDFYIGNDGEEADFLHNQKDLRFDNTGGVAGLAMHDGDVMAAMGCDWGDYDRDGLLDLCVSGFSNQSYAVFRNLGNMLFDSVSKATGIAGPTFMPLGFGSKWMEMDNDGWVDLTFVNGHVYEQTEQIEAGTMYRQPVMLFHNRQGRSFKDLVPLMGPDVGRPMVGRGSATGDFDNDGRLDLLAVDHEGPLMLLHNLTQTDHHWIKLDLRTPGPKNRFAYSARVTAQSGGKVWINEVSPATSHLSSSDPRIHWGLGPCESLEKLTIRWPDSTVEELENVAGDRILTIQQGQGIVAEVAP